MRQNVGNLDRWIRYTLSAAIVAGVLAFHPSVYIVTPLAFFAGLLFCSATSRVCPIYCPMGINTGAPASE